MPEKVVTLASTTSTQAELEHAASDDWRSPFTAPAATETEGAESSATEDKIAAESETASTEQSAGKNGKNETHTSGWQKRIDRLTARNKRIETENAELRARLETPAAPRQADPTPAVAATKPAQTGVPQLKDYASAEEWFDARLEHTRKQEREQQESTASNEEIRQTWEAHNSRISEARAKYADFDEVAETFGNIEIPQASALAIIEQPNSADVTYYLATHTEEAKKLANMRPLAQVAAIARISDKVAGSSASATAPKPKPASQAPAPIKPVGTGATGSTVDLGSLSYQDYKKARTAGRSS